MSEHTPTPWKTSGRANKQSNFGDYRCIVTHTANDGIRDFNETVAYALGGVKEAREVAEANAAFIVKAVNSHDALVKALRNCRERLKMDLDEIQHLRGWLSDSEMAERADQDEVADEADKKAIADADKALAVAEGQS